MLYIKQLEVLSCCISEYPKLCVQLLKARGRKQELKWEILRPGISGKLTVSLFSLLLLLTTL